MRMPDKQGLDAERWRAWVALLATPDDPPMIGRRRHRVTAPAPTPRAGLAAALARAYTAHRLQARRGDPA